MRFPATIRTIRACALGLWLGVGLSLLTAIPVIIRFRAADQMRACEIVNTLILNAGKARLALALLALATQAVLFYSRSASAPSGWRRFASVLLVMAAVAAAIAVEFSLSLTLVLSHSGVAAAARVAPQAQLQLSLIGMALLVLEMILVAAALATGAARGGSAADIGKIENRKSKI